MDLSTTELSSQKKQLKQLIDKINQLAFQCAYADPLIKGTPGEVLKRCGRKNCKCATDPAKRHGPYPVIQIYQNNKKQRQIVLRKDQKQFWEQARNYQKQMAVLSALKKTCAELTGLVEKVLMNRVEKWP